MSTLFFGKIQRIFVARPARYVRGGFLPHAACRSGHLRGVTIMSHSVRCRYATEAIAGKCIAIINFYKFALCGLLNCHLKCEIFGRDKWKKAFGDGFLKICLNFHLRISFIISEAEE